MLRKSIAIIVVSLIINACSPVATPLPLPTATSTVRPSPTLSNEEKTAAASFNATTLPASFTPTFTPTITSTPTATFTPTVTFTPTPIPEDILCEEFSIGFASQGIYARDELEDVIQIYSPYPEMIITGEIRNLTTDEIVDEGTLQGRQSWTLDFTPNVFPDIGQYEWVFSLSDATRTGMCEQKGTFETSAEELEAFFTPEPGLTAESTIEANPEVTVEATEESSPVATAGAPEMTEEATSAPFIFPPR